MGRFIVMDIVFYGSSLNYDQGTGNYQELKKITKWDGRQYTLVSRYALRYSLLETAKNMGLWNIADGSKLQRAGEGNQTVIQPSEEVLLSGEILKYPEFDLFGYLITSTTPPNFKEASAKISHAVSLTPFNYDALFNANVGLANRMRKITGMMEPNPFTAEEHETYYQYSVVIDIDKIGKIEIYLAKTIKEGNKQRTMNAIEIVEDSKGCINFKIQYSGRNEPLEFKYQKDENNSIYLSRLILPFREKDNKVKFSEELKDVIEFNNNAGAMVVEYRLKDEKIKERVKQLISTILHLKRSIKGRDEDLSPKLMVVGIYKNHPYKTYKDRIFLVDEHYEEEYDEIEEREENGKKIVKVKHVVSKTKKPVFEVILGKTNNKSSDESNKNEEDNSILSVISEDKVVEFIEQVFSDSKNNTLSKIKVFHDPSVEVRTK